MSGFDDFTPEEDVYQTILGALLLVIIVVAPGVVTYALTAAYMSLGNTLLPDMAPDAVPRELGLYVEEWWLGAIGVAFILAASWSWWESGSVDKSVD